MKFFRRCCTRYIGIACNGRVVEVCISGNVQIFRIRVVVDVEIIRRCRSSYVSVTCNGRVMEIGVAGNIQILCVGIVINGKIVRLVVPPTF